MYRLRKYIPASWRLAYKLRQRRQRDKKSAVSQLFVQPDINNRTFSHHLFIEERQPVFRTPFSENKKHNLRLAAGCINNMVINPGQVFSFWYLTGMPAEDKGYKNGRTIINNMVSEETGGGLCQLSGIIYLLALRSGLIVLERHAHSIDIYREEERFAPAGSDATVVYGYKDLRLLNNLPQPISFYIDVQPGELIARLCSNNEIKTYTIEFRKKKHDNTILVETVRTDTHGTQTSLHTDFYKCLYSGAT